MGSRVSTCLYIDREVLERAHRMGLNVSKVSENALAEAIGRLEGPETANGSKNGSNSMVRGVGFGPTNPCGIAASGLRLWPCLATPAPNCALYFLASC